MPRKSTGGVSGKSRKTVMIGFRISKKDARKLDKRVREYPGEMSRGQYAKERFLYDLRRKHTRHGPKPKM